MATASALLIWCLFHVGCSYPTLRVHLLGINDANHNITSVQIYYGGRTIRIGIQVSMYDCKKEFSALINKAQSQIWGADTICIQDKRECYNPFLSTFPSIPFQTVKCHFPPQYPIDALEQNVNVLQYTLQDIYVRVIDAVNWKSLVLLYETKSIHLVDTIVKSLSENGVRVITLNVETKTDKDVAQFIINSFHYVGNMTIVCSNKCIGRILTMINNIDRTNLDPGAMLQRETKWIVLSVDEDSSFMLPNYASNLTNIAVIEKVQIYPNLCSDYQTIWYESKYNDNITSKNEEQLYFKTVALALVGLVYSSYTYRMQTLVFTKRGRELETVKWAINESHFYLETELFPNIKYGFNRKELLVSMLEWVPFTVKLKDGSYTGFTMIILDRLAYQLNFTYRVDEPEDGQWGVKQNGSWTGMVGLLEDKKVDLVATALTVTYERELAVDFLYPIFFDTNRIIIKSPGDEEEKWRTLIDIYNNMVLLYIGLSLAFVTVFLCVVEKINPFFSMEVNKSKSRLRTFSDCFWYNYGALLTQGGTNTPDDQTGRTILSYWWIFCMVSMAIYSGNLVAFLTVSKNKLPFETLEEMVQQDKYKWGLYGNGAMQSFFSESSLASHHTVWDKIVEFNKSDPSTLSSSEDVQYNKVVQGHYAYFGVDGVAKYYQSKGMDIQILPDVVAVIPNAFAVQKDSPYERMFSREILRMHENGLIDMWLKASYQIHTKSKEDVFKAKTITMEDLQSAFYLVGIGVTAGVISYILETVINRCKCRLRKQKECVALKRQESYDLSEIS